MSVVHFGCTTHLDAEVGPSASEESVGRLIFLFGCVLREDNSPNWQ